MGPGMMGGVGIMFGSAATPSMSPQRTPWTQGQTPGYGSSWSPGTYYFSSVIILFLLTELVNSGTKYPSLKFFNLNSVKTLFIPTDLE